MSDVEEASYSYRERFLLKICQYQFVLYMALVLEMMVLSLAVMSLLFGRLDEATQLILLFDFIILGVLIVPTVGGIYVCSRL